MLDVGFMFVSVLLSDWFRFQVGGACVVASLGLSYHPLRRP